MPANTGTYHDSNATVSARQAITITPSDSTTLVCTRAIYVGTTGNIVVTMAGDQAAGAVTFTNVPVGIFPIQVVQVLLTGTTAAGLLALY